MNDILIKILKIIGIIVISPLVGGFLSGIDRKLSARFQGRKGPSILQPFYDVKKLLKKEQIQVNSAYRFFVYLSLIFIIFTVVLIIMGGDILLAIFVLTIGSLMFVLGGYASASPYSNIGAERELLQMMAYEPCVLFVAIVLYYHSGSFFIKDIIADNKPAILYFPAVLIAFIYILTFKLRKSPFDLSMSHHGHQEIVKGVTTEFSGKDLAVIEITHWYETIMALSFIYIFVAYAAPISHLYAVLACLAAFILEIIIDNACARLKWQSALSSAWGVTFFLGAGNLIVISFLNR
ncbi:MAG: NADH-quinone oxidoreductase subunit H [Oscillospiraceae bacterium]|jgi:ech hydrogenase subunit B|nr:NADH-quinone oxidoreductase subunit H [Oscillospiraceae bacterium]